MIERLDLRKNYSNPNGENDIPRTIPIDVPPNIVDLGSLTTFVVHSPRSFPMSMSALAELRVLVVIEYLGDEDTNIDFWSNLRRQPLLPHLNRLEVYTRNEASHRQYHKWTESAPANLEIIVSPNVNFQIIPWPLLW